MKREHVYRGAYIFLFIISIARVLIQFKLPLSINVDQTADDGLLQNLALNLYNGNYLGEYDYLTLCKNNMYSYILLFCYKTMIPYTVVLSLLNIGSAFAICKALEKYLSKLSRFIIYVLLIYSPVTFSNLTALRVYRNSVLPYLVIFVFAGFIALFLRKEEEQKKTFIPWIILECICLPIFWYMKEDSIWVLPFCIVISIMSLVWIYINDRKRILRKTIYFILPFFSVMVVSCATMILNYRYYGIATVNDRSGTEAADFYANLLRIEGDSGENEAVWVDDETLQLVSSVSPTFAPIYEEMKKSDAFLTDGELYGDYYIWKIRFIMDELGYYKTASKANETYEKMNDELEEAFSNGDIQKDNLIHLSPQMKGLTVKEIIGFIPTAIKNMVHTSTYGNLELVNLGSHGDVTKLTTQQYLLGNNTFKEHTTDFQIEAKEYQTHFTLHANFVIGLYQRFGKIFDFLSIVSIMFYVIILFRDMVLYKKFKECNLFIVLCGIILSAFVVALEVELFMSWFSTEMYKAFLEFYSVSEYPLIEIFKYVSIAWFIEYMYKNREIILRK